ncbi:LacI family DNA-binding transcriptional regulator [Naasia lichenicola]|uniref:LacI family DNA-binding transcriptional regulator n=1 Tax=Naasia lichenicola TaxID=2565933 RepID=A0A4S4FRH6_9MICO|nr:LacI family DNA-binding transcriptional regulator [Naasia lichenicola]AGU10285.1 Periplasmic binding protein-like domain [uncultured organism]THG32908.1 LacI family DNA-binding transcriptional regulator [Naasia lichenicola]
MATRASIHDVAAAAGVSVATVSKAVNGRYGVAPGTAARVMRAVAELGYESSLIASSMRSRRTGVIGVLVADFEPFSAEVLKGVGAGLHGSQYDLLAFSGSHLGDGEGWERRSLSRLSGTLIDGAIMVTPTVTNVSADVPIVAIDPHAGRADLPTVEADSHGGARRAVDYLIELGHRRIGFIAGRPDLKSSRLRDAGYRDALRSAGIPFDPVLTRVGFYESQSTRDVARTLLLEPDRPTAVFAANDLSAIAVIEVAHELGLDVPRDLSVIGFDDIPEAAQNGVPLTTIRQPMGRIGQTAAEMVTALMAGEKLAATHVLLPTRLIPRASTAAPR